MTSDKTRRASAVSLNIELNAEVLSTRSCIGETAVTVAVLG
jgi:hypothetical protein